MSNVLTNTNTTIVLNAAIEAFVSELTPILAFSNNFSPNPADKGNKVRVLQYATSSGATGFNGSYAAVGSTVTGLDVTLNKHKIATWGLTDVEVAENSNLSLIRMGTQKGAELAKLVWQDILSVVTAANYGAAGLTSSAGNFDSDDVADLAAVATGADWPSQMRSLIIRETYFASLVKDNAIQGTMGVERSGALAENAIPRLHKFNVYESAPLPANSENLVGFICHPDAVLVSMRYLQPQVGNTYNEARAVTDPNGSGITLGFRDFYDNDAGQRIQVLEAFYGYVKGNTGALKRIVSS